jgi:hypothetical protein
MNIYFLFFCSLENRLFISSRPRHPRARRMKVTSAANFAEAKRLFCSYLSPRQRVQFNPSLV